MCLKYVPWGYTLLFVMVLASSVKAIDYRGVAIPATSADLDKEIQAMSLEMPQASFEGNVPTLNKMGHMLTQRDAISDAFLDSAATWGRQDIASLDVGAAYGVITLPALERGALMIANDLDRKQLLILRTKTPAHFRHRLFLKSGNLVGGFSRDKVFRPNSLGAILLRRIMHFLNPAEIDVVLDNLYDWLVPGGSIFIVNMSPYHPMVRSLAKTYEERWQQGNPWPGEIFNMHTVAPDRTQFVPQYLHVTDTKPWVQALQKKGFIIKKAVLYGYKMPGINALETDGHCGIIAQKPL